MRKTILLVVAFLFFLLVGFFGMVVYQGFRFSQTFFTAAQLSPKMFVNEVWQGWNEHAVYPNNAFNVLVLGTDSLSGRPDDSVLTDTMMLVSVGVATGKITTISIPRDLWVADYRTKINALYQYGKQKYPDQPERFPREVMTQITGQNIQHTFVVSLDDLKTLIDSVGGIDVSVSRGFTDAMFPIPGVDVTKEHDPKRLYMTVAFPQGMNHMSGDVALQFIRSRHSTDPQEGTDDARVIRQQQVIMSLVHTVVSKKVVLNPETLGRVYQWYAQRFQANVPVHELVTLAKTMRPVMNNFSLHEYAFPVQEQDKTGLLYHPVKPVDGQWVYLPVDASWTAIKNAVSEQL